MMRPNVMTAAASAALLCAGAALAQDPVLGETDPIISDRALGADGEARDPGAVVDEIVEQGRLNEDGVVEPATGAAEPTESWLGCPPDRDLAGPCVDPERPTEEALDDGQPEGAGSSGESTASR